MVVVTEVTQSPSSIWNGFLGLGNIGNGTYEGDFGPSFIWALRNQGIIDRAKIGLNLGKVDADGNGDQSSITFGNSDGSDFAGELIKFPVE